MSQYEIEIKSLLGDETAARSLVEKMQGLDPACQKLSHNSQLNHYFTGGDVHKLYEKVEHLFTGDQHERFQRIAEKGSDFSVRTRQRNEEVLLVVKASLDGGTSSNTVSRLEFEEPVELTLNELDELVLSSGYVYEAKWSRDRDEYQYKDIAVCIDHNAGYGYLAEFETVTDDESGLEGIRANLETLMKELEVAELSQERLARMFAHYNENWGDYYGTKKIFNIE
jgi:adenylate cyclase class IV